MGDLEDLRGAPVVRDLIERFEREHLAARRPNTRRDYGLLLRNENSPRARESESRGRHVERHRQPAPQNHRARRDLSGEPGRIDPLENVLSRDPMADAH